MLQSVTRCFCKESPVFNTTLTTMRVVGGALINVRIEPRVKVTSETKMKYMEDIKKGVYPRHIQRCYILLGLLDYMQIMFRLGTWIPTDLYNS